MQIKKIDTEYLCRDCDNTANYEVEYLMTANEFHVCETCAVEAFAKAKRLEEVERMILQGMKMPSKIDLSFLPK